VRLSFKEKEGTQASPQLKNSSGAENKTKPQGVEIVKKGTSTE
jgi:hypothetical protein